MRRIIIAVGLVIACGLVAFAQRTELRAATQGSNEASASARNAGSMINIQSDTRLAAELQNTIDVRKAKPGDQVAFKTTEPIKSNGRTLVSKGARLIGHVTEVEQKTRDNAESHIGLVFDRLENGSLAVPISATITSITQARGRARTSNADADARSMSSASSNSRVQRTSASGGAGGGGLVGGVSNTVGGVVNNTASTVGSVVDGTTSVVGSTVSSTGSVAGETRNGLSSSLGGLRITQSSSTSAAGSSTLSLTGGNLRLEKGTTFNVVISQSASTSASKEQ